MCWLVTRGQRRMYCWPHFTLSFSGSTTDWPESFSKPSLREMMRFGWYSRAKKQYLDKMVCRFQRARRVVWAELQNIVYGQFLQILLGDAVMQQQNLTFDLGHQYDQNMNPGIRNSFATAAFRFGHSGLPTHFETRSVTTGQISVHNLQDHFFNLRLYYSNDAQGMEDILHGMLYQGAKSIDRFITQDVNKFLFANVNGLGQDLAARNIQRGREHGLPEYNAYREFCGMPRVCTWNRPPAEIGAPQWLLLKTMYTSPSDIDLFAAGLAERPHAGGVVGRTFSCILAKQFHQLKFGDR